jgi:uncharacterized protein YaaN involved in tellurite resistance
MTTTALQTAAAETGVDLIAPNEKDSQALEQFDPNTLGQGNYFLERFRDKPGAIEALQQEARSVAPAMLEDTNVLVNYGTGELEEVRKSTLALNQINGDKVELPPEDEKALKLLSIQMRNASKYDLSVAENVARYNRMKDGLTKLFGGRKAKAYFQAFQADRKTLEQLVDQMSGDLQKQAMERTRAAGAISRLYEANQESLIAMSERLAVLEIIRDMAVAERAKYPETLPHDHEDAPQVRALEMFVRMANLKLGEYAARWYTGVALSPIFEAQYEQNLMMGFKLRVAATDGMDKIKLIIATYKQSLDLKSDSDRLAGFEKFDNELTQSLARQTRSVLTATAKQTTSSSMTVETITVVANEVAGMVDDIQLAYKQSQAEEALKREAMKNGVEILEKAQASGQADTSKVAGVVAASKTIRSITGAF